jgi:hypothetical protein
MDDRCFRKVFPFGATLPENKDTPLYILLLILYYSIYKLVLLLILYYFRRTDRNFEKFNSTDRNFGKSNYPLTTSSIYAILLM